MMWDDRATLLKLLGQNGWDLFGSGTKQDVFHSTRTPGSDQGWRGAVESHIDSPHRPLVFNKK